MQSQFQAECSICCPQTATIRKSSIAILKLVKIVKNQKKQQKKLISLPTESYFKQLVDYLKLQISKNQMISTQCSHKNLKNYLTKKLGISLEELFCLSEHIYNSLSKRKFELELIEKIAKNVHEQVFQINKTEKKSQATLKRTKEIKTKTSIQVEVPTIHSIQSQKGQQNKQIQQNQPFSKKLNIACQQNFIRFQDQSQFYVPNFGIESNGFWPQFYGTEFCNQGMGYAFDDIRMFVSNGFFAPTLPSLNN